MSGRGPGLSLGLVGLTGSFRRVNDTFRRAWLLVVAWFRLLGSRPFLRVFYGLVNRLGGVGRCLGAR